MSARTSTRRPGRGSLEVCDHARSANARSHDEAERLQPSANNRGRAPFRERELGVPVQVTPEPDEVRLEAGNGLGQSAQRCCSHQEGRSVAGLYAGTLPGCGSRPSCCSCPNTSTTSQCSVSFPFSTRQISMPDVL